MPGMRFLGWPAAVAAATLLSCGSRTASDPAVLWEGTAQMPGVDPEHWRLRLQRAAWGGRNAVLQVAPDRLAIVEAGKVRMVDGRLLANPEGLPIVATGSGKAGRIQRLDSGTTFDVDLDPPAAGPAVAQDDIAYPTELWAGGAKGSRLLRVVNGASWSVLHVYGPGGQRTFAHELRPAGGARTIAVADALLTPDDGAAVVLVDQDGSLEAQLHDVAGGKKVWTASLGQALGDGRAMLAVTPDGALVLAADNLGIHVLGRQDGRKKRSFAAEVPENFYYRGISGSTLWFSWFDPPVPHSDAAGGLPRAPGPPRFTCLLTVFDIDKGKLLRAASGQPAGFGPRWSKMIEDCTVRALVGLPDGSVEVILQEPDDSARVVQFRHPP